MTKCSTYKFHSIFEFESKCKMQNVSGSIYDSIFSIVWNDSITVKHRVEYTISSVSDTTNYRFAFCGRKAAIEICTSMWNPLSLVRRMKVYANTFVCYANELLYFY